MEITISARFRVTFVNVASGQREKAYTNSWCKIPELVGSAKNFTVECSDSGWKEKVS